MAVTFLQHTGRTLDAYSEEEVMNGLFARLRRTTRHAVNRYTSLTGSRHNARAALAAIAERRRASIL